MIETWNNRVDIMSSFFFFFLSFFSYFSYLSIYTLGVKGMLGLSARETLFGFFAYVLLIYSLCATMRTW
jgi:hypothetical protein